MLCYCKFADFDAWPSIIHSAKSPYLPDLLTLASCFLCRPSPVLSLFSAGRTGQQDDLLPEFDVEIMPGTATHLQLLSHCLPSSSFFLMPPDVRFPLTNQNSLWLTKILFIPESVLTRNFHIMTKNVQKECLTQPETRHSQLLKIHKKGITDSQLFYILYILSWFELQRGICVDLK